MKNTNYSLRKLAHQTYGISRFEIQGWLPKEGMVTGAKESYGIGCKLEADLFPGLSHDDVIDEMDRCSNQIAAYAPASPSVVSSNRAVLISFLDTSLHAQNGPTPAKWNQYKAQADLLEQQIQRLDTESRSVDQEAKRLAEKASFKNESERKEYDKQSLQLQQRADELTDQREKLLQKYEDIMEVLNKMQN